jgi:hypothetical protein
MIEDKICEILSSVAKLQDQLTVPKPKPIKIPPDYKLIKSRFPGRCRVCGLGFEKGDTIAYGKGPPVFTAHQDCVEG